MPLCLALSRTIAAAFFLAIMANSAVAGSVKHVQSQTLTAKEKTPDLGNDSSIEAMMDALANDDGTSQPGSSRISGNNAPGGTARNLQKWLKALGCYHGAIDGLWGSGSQRALTAAIGAPKAASGATPENLSRVEAVAHLDVCKDLPAIAASSTKPRPPKVSKRQQRKCMPFAQCMSACSNGTLGSNTGTGAYCSSICGSEVPVC